MSDVKVVPFEPERASSEEWARLHAWRRKRHMETDPDDPMLADATLKAIVLRPDPHWRRTRFVVLDAEQPDLMIGFLAFEVPRPDAPDYEENKHLVWVDLELLAPYRRQGFGRRLLKRVVGFAREHDASLIVGYSEEADGMAFIEAIGAQLAQRTRQSRLTLADVDWDMADQWVAEGPVRSPDSTLRWFTNRVDDDLIEEWCAAFTEVWNMMPRDDLDIGDEVTTPERVRQDEARIAEAGGTTFTAYTQEADGAISGLTQMGHFPDEDWMIHQWMTGVRRPYRGRGLGKWLKAAMIQRVRQELPHVKVVVTGNAFSNAPMLSINERLGFKLYREGMEVQIGLEDLEAYLANAPRSEEPILEAEDGLTGI